MATDPIVEMDNVVAGYGAMTILNGTSFKIARGAITTVIGPNGAGKSTVFKTIFGLLRPRSGSVRVDGARCHRLVAARSCSPRASATSRRGATFFPSFPCATISSSAPSPPGREIKDMPARLEAALDRFPALRRKADQQASTLSGGEQKQLEIVRGLLLDPKLILIDEPSIGLSPLMVQETFALLTRLRDKGASILMIEQNARSALQMSDYGLVLELGQTRMHDTAAAILNDPRVAQFFLGGVIEV